MANIITPRQLPAPTPMRDAMRAFARISRHTDATRIDPHREALIDAALARGKVTISSIASASAALPVNATGVHHDRRQWRFRALDAESHRVLYEQIVEGENREAAEYAGRRDVERHWRKYGNPKVKAVIGTVVAI
jgi:hypothetical protein